MTSSAGEEFAATHLLGGQDRVPRLGYGAMQLAGPGVIGLPDDVPGAIEVLRRAVDRGVRFFDTANAYGPRSVNQIIGRALSPFADDIVIGNKVGAWRDAAGGWLTDNRPETVRAQVEDALLDMRAGFSPLTYLRLPGDSQAPGNTPLRRCRSTTRSGALVELRDEGKIRHIGLSGASPEMLERAQQVTPIAAVQNRFNLIDRSGVEVLAACERHGIAFVPYFPLATGFLGEPRGADAARPAAGVSTSAVALAWLLRRSPVMVPIPGTKSLGHLGDNIGATEVAAQLTSEEVRSADRGRRRTVCDVEHDVGPDDRRRGAAPGVGPREALTHRSRNAATRSDCTVSVPPHRPGAGLPPRSAEVHLEDRKHR